MPIWDASAGVVGAGFRRFVYFFEIMARLAEDQKRYIVQCFARFMGPTEIVRSVKETLGVEVTKQQVWHYRPDSADVKPTWRTLFDETRKQFLADTASIGISHLSVRLRRLERIADRAMESKNGPLEAQIMEQAAREVGGAFSNKREISGPGGAAIPFVIEDAFLKVYGERSASGEESKDSDAGSPGGD